MRGLVGLVLLAVACSSPAGSAETQGLGGAEAAGASQAGAGAGAGAGSPSAAAAGDNEQAGAQASAGAPAGGAGGSLGHPEAGTGGAQGGAPAGGAPAGGAAPMGGAPGAAGQAGAPSASCSGFTTYVIDAGTCLSVTGDYQQQPSVSCSPDGVVSRDHCSTCASWTAVDKPSTVMLSIAQEAILKRYDAAGGVCPSNCKYICN